MDAELSCDWVVEDAERIHVGHPRGAAEHRDSFNPFTAATSKLDVRACNDRTKRVDWKGIQAALACRDAMNAW